MPFKTPATEAEQWAGRRFDFAEYGNRLAALRADFGNPELPRNSGTRRTASKRALLAAIEVSGGDW